MNASLGETRAADTRSAALAELIDRLTDRALAGERLDLDRLIADHPDHADALRALLPAVGLLGELSRSRAAGSVATSPLGPAVADGTLGDFRVVREVGRGGMGVVYEAEQISLRRRVALKVLPFAAVADPRSLQRFRNEALAAAGLDHPHVVKVYGVGCERGVHFIALQYIDGRPLSDLIRERRGQPADPPTPPTATAAADATASYAPGRAAPAKVGRGTSATPRGDDAYYRRVAEWGVQAADALEHAHALGVVHRDVKPGNILVDGAGKVYVADFGLAKLTADPGVTGTGDLLGTVRYMSPEQAAAKHDLVDHRSDVYSLGVTLYELLALQPAFTGADRQAVLTAVLTSDPAGLRSHDRGIPRDLETVILKAMDKDPARRYPTAKEFAADLRRYLTHESVRAKPPGVIDRVGKWARRHRLTITSIGIGAALVILPAGVGTGWVLRDRAVRQVEDVRLTDVSLTEADQARRAGRLTDALTAIRQAEQHSSDGRTEKDTQARVATARRDVEMLIKLDRLAIDAITARDRIRDWRLGGPEQRYRQAFREYGADPDNPPAEVAARLRGETIREELALALDRWAEIRVWMAESSPARWQELVELAREIDPDATRNEIRSAILSGEVKPLLAVATSARLRELSPNTLVLLAGALDRLKDEGTALRCLQVGVHYHPADFMLNASLAQVLVGRGPGDQRLAVGYMRVVRAARPDSAPIAAATGTILTAGGLIYEAEAVLREAIRLEPGSAEAHNNLAVVLGKLKKHKEALAEQREAARLDPEDPTYQRNLGIELADQGQYDEGIKHICEAIRLRPDLAIAHWNLGNVLHQKGDLAGAAAAFRRADDLDSHNPEVLSALATVLAEADDLNAAVEVHIRALQLDPQRGASHRGYAMTLARQGKHAEALESNRMAARLNPNDVEAHITLGDLLQMSGKLEDAVASYKNALKVAPDDFRALANMGQALNNLGRHAEAVDALRRATVLQPESVYAYAMLGTALNAAGRWADAKAAFETALRLNPEFAPALNNFAVLLLDCPDAKWQDPKRAVQHAKKAVELNPREWQYRNTLGTAYNRTGQWKEAVTALTAGLTLHDGGDANDFFELAIATWQLGEKEKAREWYRKGTRWLEKNPTTKEITRVKKEADAVVKPPLEQLPPPRPNK